MVIGNKPKDGSLPLAGKRYWWLAIGRNALQYRMFDGGWRGFEFVVLTPYYTDDLKEAGDTRPYLIQIAFAYWLPFYKI